jgi:hypothetical protein
MIAVWLRAMGFSALVFALLVAAIRLQPRDDTAMRAFFSAENCAAPCFLGIRPNVTTHDEAADILRAQPWVGKLTVSRDSLYWAWNGKQPAFINPRSGDFKNGQISFARGLVASISVSTEMNWGQFRVVFGKPDKELFVAGESPSGYYPYLFHSAAYQAGGFEVDTNTFCPLKSRADLWDSAVTLVMPIHPTYDLIPVGIC